MKRYEVTLVLEAVDVKVTRIVVEAEDEEAAGEKALEMISEGWGDWEHVKRKFEDVDVEEVREVAADTPLAEPLDVHD